MENMVIKNKSIVEDDLKFINQKIKNKKFFRNKKIIIFGSEGFIGFYLKKYFIKYFQKLKLSELILADKKLRKTKYISKRIKEIKFDLINDNFAKFNIKSNVIIHAASIASPVFYRKYPLKTSFVNTEGIKKILEYSKIKKNISILFFSSSEIYGNPNTANIPTRESYNGNVACCGPRACYDESKRYAETLCYIYAKYFKVSVKVARPFNNYGPGLNINDGRVPSDFARSVLNKKNIILYSDGTAKRSFCYIADACAGYINMIPLKKYTILNIGNTKEITIEQLAKTYQTISKIYLNFYPKIIFKKHKDKNYLTDNPERRCPDLRMAKKIIKYKIHTNIENGIKKYLQFLKYEYKRN